MTGNDLDVVLSEILRLLECLTRTDHRISNACLTQNHLQQTSRGNLTDIFLQ